MTRLSTVLGRLIEARKGKIYLGAFNDMLIALKDVNKCNQQPVCNNKAIYISDKTVVCVTKYIIYYTTAVFSTVLSLDH